MPGPFDPSNQPTIFNTMENETANASNSSPNVPDNTSDEDLAIDDLAEVAGGGETAYNGGKVVGDAIEDTFDWCVTTATKFFSGRLL